MNALKFMKIDYRITKTQNKLFLLFVAVAIFAAVKSEKPLWAIGYLCFGSILLSTTPFTIQTSSNSGFINLLPASTLSRVMGRFLFSTSMALVGLVFGELVVVICYVINQTGIDYIIPFSMIVFAISVMVIAVQNLILYYAGNIKSQQIMAILRMIPGFLFFFGGSYLLDYINKNSEKSLVWIKYLQNHLSIASGLAVVISIFIVVICVVASNYTLNNRDVK